jgi:hypothetical protein
MTPVMIAGLILVLQGYDPLPFVAWAAPAAFGVAFAWTWYRMRSLIVEMIVTHNGAAALTVLESLRHPPKPRIQRVFDVRSVAQGLQVTIGRATYVLDTGEWAESADMARALTQAKLYYD